MARLSRSSPSARTARSARVTTGGDTSIDWGRAPREDGLVYPGRWPDEAILLTEVDHHPLALAPGRPVAEAKVGGYGTPLDQALARLGQPVMAARFPVLAVGSNAAPAQIRHKLAAPRSPVMPLVDVTVTGLAVGVAAQVAPYGALPATPVFGPDLSCRLFVAWLDSRQLDHMDRSEGAHLPSPHSGYERRLLAPADTGHPVEVVLPTGEALDSVFAYVARSGCLVHPDGEETGVNRPLLPIEDGMASQRTLISRMVALSPGLRDLLGATAEQWEARVRAAPDRIAPAVHRILVDEGRVLPVNS